MGNHNNNSSCYIIIYIKFTLSNIFMIIIFELNSFEKEKKSINLIIILINNTFGLIIYYNRIYKTKLKLKKGFLLFEFLSLNFA